MERYQRAPKPKSDRRIDENEIRITSQGRARSYIIYAMSLLQVKGYDEVVFTAMGKAIGKTVAIVESIKRRIPGLYQNTSIGFIDVTDTWEPLEEGLLTLDTTRLVTLITITLSKKELNESYGYQPAEASERDKPDGDTNNGSGIPTVTAQIYVVGDGNAIVDFEAEGRDGYWYHGRGIGRGRKHQYYRGLNRGHGGHSNFYYEGTQDVYYGYDALTQGRGRGRGNGYLRRGREPRSNLPDPLAA